MATLTPPKDATPTLLKLVLQLHGEFRKILEPIHVTPLQAGVMLYLYRHVDAKQMDAADSIGVRVPTLSQVATDLVRKLWVIKRRSVTDSRALCLRLSKQGLGITKKIEQKVGQVNDTLESLGGDTCHSSE